MIDGTIRVLFVDDSKDDFIITRSLLMKAEDVNFEVEWSATYEDAVEKMDRAMHNVCIVDYRLKGKSGLELLKTAAARNWNIPIIFLTAYEDRSIDIKAMQTGAVDYLIKGRIDTQLLERSIRYAIERKQNEEELKKYRNHLEELVKERTSRLEKVEERMKLLLESIEDIFIMQDLDGKYLYFSSSSCYGLTTEDMLDKKPFDFHKPEFAARMMKRIKKVARSGKSLTEEIEVPLKGKKLWFLEQSTPVKDEAGNVVAITTICRNITKLKKKEEQLQVSLREKEVLLREIHHRVKNNLQIISSLINMISMRTKNRGAIDLFWEARNKIQTMALIHAQLYEREQFDSINMVKYVDDLTNYLTKVYNTVERSITAVVKGTPVYLNVNQAVPCALALNELISNCFKHAFEGRDRGRIVISMGMLSGGMVKISVKDDGVGMPEGVDINETESLGLELVKILVLHQLQGKIQVGRVKGTRIIIAFRITK